MLFTEPRAPSSMSMASDTQTGRDHTPRRPRTAPPGRARPHVRPHTAAGTMTSRSRKLRKPTTPGRPRTTPGPGTRPKEGEGLSRKEYMEQFEALEFEWPDLPPVQGLKEAITRQKVSKGMSYLLPVDKTKSSVEGVYRTDLRMMFRDPYVRDDQAYDDLKVRASSKYHFAPNTAPRKVKIEALHPGNFRLNAESEEVRRQFACSAPVTGQKGYLDMDPTAMRQRSSLYLPLKVKIPPELAKLKEEADKIVQSLQGKPKDEDESDQERELEEEKLRTTGSMTDRQQMDALYRKMLTEDGGAPAKLPRSMLRRKETVYDFKSYDAIKNAKAPEREIPEVLRTPYLPKRKSSDIWKWMHRDEKISDFDYFLSVCS